MKQIIILLSAIIFITAGTFLFLNSPPLSMHEDTIMIEKGDSLRQAAANLEQKNLIHNKLFFVYLSITGKKNNIITGKYKIYRGMTSWAILRKISAGDVIKHKVMIPEGFNIYETAEKLEQNGITDADDFLKYASDAEFLQSIGINMHTAEGFIFPATYYFSEQQDAREILSAMHRQFENVISSIKLSGLKKNKLDLEKLITLASLIEKEAAIESERKYISSVFHNRISLSIPLGCDPSIKYAVKKFKGRLTLKDLRFDSPYNTYLYKGLPPGPICSPGRNSIDAALRPADTQYLYFVSRNNGSHYFSKTLKDHSKAVDYYQKGLRNGFIDGQKI